MVGSNGIRRNAVATGPIWSLDTLDARALSLLQGRKLCSNLAAARSSVTEGSIRTPGTTVPMECAGQSVKIATYFVFLASADSSCIRCVLPFVVRTPKCSTRVDAVAK